MIDCEWTDEVVCPYCGYEHTDSWEFFRDDYDNSRHIECEECEKKFFCEADFSITYTSKEIAKEAKP